MRSLESARESWQSLKRCNTLREIKDAVRLSANSSLANDGCRSACWKAFLLFDTLDLATWQQTLSYSRFAYNSLRAKFLSQDELEAGHDPLSEQAEASPWTQLRQDEELRAEIMQDVARCMPENLYFRQPDTQRMLLDILFVFCKLNPDVSYRQGMHELLAPILWVVERDAIELGQSSKAMGEDAMINNLYDADHIEHDTFALFGQMMQSAKNFYEQTTTSGNENPIVARSRIIFDDLLPKVDDELAKHLQRIEILPQIFMMRWIRLLFGREFEFDGMLTMWDTIFAEDAALEIVNEVCLAMLLRVRWELVDADYNAALTILLHYPAIEKDFSSQTFVLDALYLRDHMDYHGGSYLISKYTGRSLSQPVRPKTPPALQRNVTTVSGIRPGSGNSQISRSSPSPASGSAREINKVIQSTAKDLYARGEKLGIGKVVRNAVDEVHKRAQEIRDTQTPSAPMMHRQRGSRMTIESDALLQRVKALEERNQGLAKLLEGAIADLWAFQKTFTETSEQEVMSDGNLPVESLSAAIAKAQFVQVYLEDSSLHLSEDMSGEQTEQGLDGTLQSAQPSRSTAGQDSPRNLPPRDAMTNDGTAAPMSGTPVPGIVVGDGIPDLQSKKSSSERPDVQIESRTRPRLEQSSFSWMLGEEGSSSSTRTHTPSFTSERVRSKGFLFGDEAG